MSKRGALATWILALLFSLPTTHSDPILPELTVARSLKEHWAGFYAGFRDTTFETVGLDPISDDVWVWRWIIHATNTGSVRGLPATGHKVVQPGCEFMSTCEGNWTSRQCELGISPCGNTTDSVLNGSQRI